MTVNETLKQVIYRALGDAEFGKHVAQLPLTNDYFGEQLDLVKIIDRHYNHHDGPLSKQGLLLNIEQDLTNRHKMTDVSMENYRNLVNDIMVSDQSANYVSDMTVKESTNAWLRQKMGTNAIVTSLSNGKLDDLHTIEQLADEMMKISQIGEGNDIIKSQDLFGDNENAAKVYDIIKDAMKGAVTTGFKELDDVMAGGLKPKELAMVIGKTGQGKTLTLMNMAVNYLLNRQDVVFLELEENRDQMITKLLSTLIKVQRSTFYGETGDVNNIFFKEVMTRLDNEHQQGKVGQFTLWDSDESYQVTLKLVEQKLKQYFDAKNHYPTVLIVDYPDLMKNDFEGGSRRDEKSQEMLFHGLRALAKKYGMIIWVANQTNRNAYYTNTIGIESIEGAKAKVNACELVFSVNSTSEEFEQGFTRFKLLKVRNRNGNYPPDGIIQLRVDQSCGRYHTETDTEKEAHKQLLDEMGTAMEGSQDKPVSNQRKTLDVEKLKNKLQ